MESKIHRRYPVGSAKRRTLRSTLRCVQVLLRCTMRSAREKPNDAGGAPATPAGAAAARPGEKPRTGAAPPASAEQTTALAAWYASCCSQLDKQSGCASRLCKHARNTQRSTCPASGTATARRSMGAAPGSVLRSVPQRQSRDASDSPSFAAPAPSCVSTALISAIFASCASAVPSTTPPGPQSMPSTNVLEASLILLPGLCSEFAAALSQQSSSAAALSSAAAALLVGNRGSDDANSDLIVPTHLLVGAPYGRKVTPDNGFSVRFAGAIGTSTQGAKCERLARPDPWRSPFRRVTQR